MWHQLFDRFKKKATYLNQVEADQGQSYEYCLNCDANLTLQKGYSNDLPYWICKGCGTGLKNPKYCEESEIIWICDECGAALFAQEGFTEDCGSWQCRDCGLVNEINKSKLYPTEEAFEAYFKDPYTGLSDEAILDLSIYHEEGSIDNRDDVLLVRNIEDDTLYVKKILSTYNSQIYEYLMANPIPGMPRIISAYESKNNLIVIEEYVEGYTLSEMIAESPLEIKKALFIAKELARILENLHNQNPPIIHRDIKPSNIIITARGQVVLLDVNIAKWFNEDEREDTRLLGTQYYAAPEQLGYGFSASSPKVDIHAMGMLINVMVTGCLPKEERANEPVWSLVNRCIALDPEDRYTDQELISSLDRLLGICH